MMLYLLDHFNNSYYLYYLGWIKKPGSKYLVQENKLKMNDSDKDSQHSK